MYMLIAFNGSQYVHHFSSISPCPHVATCMHAFGWLTISTGHITSALSLGLSIVILYIAQRWHLDMHRRVSEKMAASVGRRAPWLGLLFLAAGVLLLQLALAKE